MAKIKKTIMLYSVMCGLYFEQSLFSPFPNIDGSYKPDFKEALKTYNSITAQSFDKKEVLIARMKGHRTYNKYIIQVEVPMQLFNRAMKQMQEFVDKEAINECVWEESVNWKFDNVRDELFDIEGGISSLHITNVREWTKEEITT